MNEDKKVTDGNEKVVAPIVGEGFFPGFIPIREELLALVRFWEQTALTTIFLRFARGRAAGAEPRAAIRVHENRPDRGAAQRRPAVEEVIDKATDEFGAKQDDLEWRAFIGTATPEEEQKCMAKWDALMSGEGEALPSTA